MMKKMSMQEAVSLAAEKFPERAYLYAVLDDSVGFGLYENGHFCIGKGKETVPGALDWNYLQELRIFNRSRELRLICSEGEWYGRVREFMPGKLTRQEVREYRIEECQKLWGKINRREGIPGWTCLESERGTRLQIPVNMDDQNENEAAVLVLKFMRIPDVKKNEELVWQNDICLADFIPWKGGSREWAEKKIKPSDL